MINVLKRKPVKQYLSQQKRQTDWGGEGTPDFYKEALKNTPDKKQSSTNGSGQTC